MNEFRQYKDLLSHFSFTCVSMRFTFHFINQIIFVSTENLDINGEYIKENY